VRQDITADALFGALAGTVATLVMSQVTAVLYEREGRATRRRENRARGGSDTNTIAARKAARLFGADLTDEQAANAGAVAHHAIGAGAGAAYAVVRRQIPAPAVVRGLGFGAALWLVADEIGNPALGITPGPAAFPWQAHARGLAGHLVFGLVTEAVLSVADSLRTRTQDRAEGGRPRESHGLRLTQGAPPPTR
jgi:uncharacterized membrane protein YagU involved in acid resistance